MKISWGFILLSFFLSLSCAQIERKDLHFVYYSPEKYSRLPASEFSCGDIFSRIFSRQRGQDFLTVRKALFHKIDKLDRSERFGLYNALESFHFVDYSFSVAELNQLRKRALKIEELEFPFAFNLGPETLKREERMSIMGGLVKFFKTRKFRGMEEVLEARKDGGLFIPSIDNEKALENFMNTRMWLLEEQPEFSLESFKNVHRLMMKGEIEGVPEVLMGKIRSDNWMANISYENAINKEQLDSIHENPYLTFDEFPSFKKDGEDAYMGLILYPRVEDVKPEILERIQESHPEIYQKVVKYQREERRDFDEELTRSMINALVEERFNWFILQRDQLGDINTSEKFSKFIDLIATLQRDMVSIHPFPNGNGRSSREFLINYALIREGFFPPRLSDPDLDIYASLEKWKEVIVRGIESTERLYSDISSRIDLGLDISHSPELFLPYMKRVSPIDLKSHGSSKISKDKSLSDIDAKQFFVFLDYYLRERPDLIEKLSHDTQKALDEIEESFSIFFKKNHIDYIHKKDGHKELSLSFVDRDFESLFGRNTYTKVDVWKAKMDLWYSDETLWRGLAYKKREVSEDEILEIFSQFHPHMVSNYILRNMDMSSPESSIRELALVDFQRFNDDLYNDGIVQMARDHSEEGPLYETSYGFSTSKKRSVGKAFAMGAMSVAPYGEHSGGEFQKLLKSRILVGMRRSKKDVDLTRLKQLRSDFSYNFGRQQEVMGIGAVDPDSVNVVQTIDENGRVLLSYVRNKHDPSQVHVYAAEVDDVDKGSKEDLVRIISLPQS